MTAGPGQEPARRACWYGRLRPADRYPPEAMRHPWRVQKLARAHWPFWLVLAAGLALRTLAALAYRPALLYIDSAKYLVGSGGSEPEGYQVLLRLLDPVGGLALVAAAQHALGVAMAAGLYVLLGRRGAPRWAATLAAAPVLLDAYQLQLEQTIVPDVLFEAVLTAGLAVLLWQPTPGPRLLAAGTLLLGAATTVREIGVVLIVPAIAFALLTPRPPASRAQDGPRQPSGAGRRAGRGGRAALAAACFALPVLAYMTGALAVTGHFGLARNGPALEYGRAAAAADCATLKVPADERALCPGPERTLALGGIDGLLHNPASPGHTVPVPQGSSRELLLTRFSLAVFGQQPLRVAASVARDAVRLFALTRDGDPEIPSIARWQFQVFYPVYPREFTMAVFTRLAHQHGSGGGLAVARPAAEFLRGYQLGGGYTPGPLYAICLAAGLIGLTRRRARDGLAGACLLVTLAAVVVLLGADAFEFSWRYQLPAVVLLPLAGALGLTAVRASRTAARAAGRRQDGQTVPLRGTTRLIR